MNSLLGFTAFVIGCVVMAWVSSRSRRISAVLWTSYILRSIVVLTSVYFAALPGQAKDAAGFEARAEYWAVLGKMYLLENLHSGSQLYAWLLSAIYIFTDVSPFLGAQINAIFGAMIVWNVYQLLLEVSGQERVAVVGAWLIALFPAMILFSAQTLREVAVVYPFTLGLLYLTFWSKTMSVRYFVASVLLLLCSAAFHTGMIAAIGGLIFVIGAHLLTALARQSGRHWARASIAALMLLVAVIAVGVTGVGLEKLGALNDFHADDVGSRQLRLAQGRASYLPTLQTRTVSDLVWQSPERTAYFMFTPFPWMVRTGQDVIGLADALLYVVLWYLVARNGRTLLREPTTRALVIILIFVTVTFSLGTSNYGTALRHRAKIAPLLVVLAVLGATRAQDIRLRGRLRSNASHPPQLLRVSA